MNIMLYCVEGHYPDGTGSQTLLGIRSKEEVNELIAIKEQVKRKFFLTESNFVMVPTDFPVWK